MQNCPGILEIPRGIVQGTSLSEHLPPFVVHAFDCAELSCNVLVLVGLIFEFERIPILWFHWQWIIGYIIIKLLWQSPVFHRIMPSNWHSNNTEGETHKKNIYSIARTSNSSISFAFHYGTLYHCSRIQIFELKYVHSTQFLFLRRKLTKDEPKQSRHHPIESTLVKAMHWNCSSSRPKWR